MFASLSSKTKLKQCKSAHEQNMQSKHFTLLKQNQVTSYMCDI